MKNKTIRKRQIYKNSNKNKNKTKYLTGGAFSDYFASLKKDLDKKCISETAVNDVNSMKKQLAELQYKINKMANITTSKECPSTCMREINPLKSQINEIQLLLSNPNLTKISELNKTYRKTIAELTEKLKAKFESFGI